MDRLLEVRGLEKRLGGNRAVSRATFEVLPRSITGLIGPNGAGKTTYFNCIAGALKPDGGQVVFEGEGRSPGCPRSASTSAGWRVRSRSNRSWVA